MSVLELLINIYYGFIHEGYKGSARSEKIRPKNRAARRAAILGEFSNKGRIPSKPKVRFYVGGAISDCTRGWHLKWGKSAKF